MDIPPSLPGISVADLRRALLDPRSGQVAGHPGPTVAADGLDDLSRRILDFEQTHPFWRHAGSKDQAVRGRFGLSSVRYHQKLNGLLDDPQALAYAPTVVNRLRALRESRTRRPGRT